MRKEYRKKKLIYKIMIHPTSHPFQHPYTSRMKFTSPSIMLCALVMSILFIFTTAAAAGPEKRFIIQPLDHFNPLNTETYHQIYIFDDSSFTVNPTSDQNMLFLYTGGEAEIDYYFSHSGGTFRQWAEQAKALVVFVEHRFYGESFPLEPHKSKYYALNVEQVVEDIAALVVKLNNDYKVKFRTITAGGSWAGEVAAYARVRFPHLIHAAMASSAPFMMMGYQYQSEKSLLSFKQQGLKQPMNFEYYRRVSSVIQQLDPECNTLTREAFQLIENYFYNKQYSVIQQKLKLCSPPTTSQDIYLLSTFIRGAFAGLVQSNHPKDDPKQSWPAIQACNVFVNFPSVKNTPLDGLAASFIAAAYGPIDKDQPCYTAYDPDWSNLTRSDVMKLKQSHTFPHKLVSKLQQQQQQHEQEDQSFIYPTMMDTSINNKLRSTLLDDDFDSWFFQMCTQTMYYQNSDGKNSTESIFPQIVTDAKTYYAECLKRYAVRSENTWSRLSTSWPNTPDQWANSPGNIVFSNGAWDPWGCGGVQKSLSATLISINIPHAAHHLDLNMPTKDDTDIVIAARKLEYQILMEMVKVEPNMALLNELRARADSRFPSVDCPDYLYP